MKNITFPLKRTDGPTSYDHAVISDAHGIPLAYILKRPAVGVDGCELADFIIESCNDAQKRSMCFHWHFDIGRVFHGKRD